MNSIGTIRHPLVRDLAWVMASPSLISSINESVTEIVSDSECLDFLRDNQQWLMSLNKEPTALVEALSKQESSRLGYYFEDLVAYWLNHIISDGYFGSHVKVSANKRDLGEFDFLFSRSQKYYHWETAVKFYLYTRDQSGVTTWYGPNANDTLHKKLSRMMAHQVRLSELTEAQPVLSEIGIEASDINPRAFLKGYLFYPFGMDNYQKNYKVADCTISPAHLKGWWLPINDLDPSKLKSLSGKALRWRLLPKLEWLAPRVYEQEFGSDLLLTEIQVTKVLHAHFSAQGESQLIAGYFLNDAGQWQEQTRGFVVNGGWPR